MLLKRIIPCLDIREGRVVKGIHFENIRDAGDPVEAAARYNREGADELTFLDINASNEGRLATLDIVERVAEQVFIPFTVAGGIQSVAQIRDILLRGADKVSINTHAVLTPNLIEDAALKFGRQCVVVAIDVKRESDGHYQVYTHGGRKPSGHEAVEWALEMETRGAGELLVTSMDADGTKAGFDIPITASISKAVGIPVIASGGAGKLKDFHDVFVDGKADAALAASVFHFGAIGIGELKRYLHDNGVPVRMSAEQ